MKNREVRILSSKSTGARSRRDSNEPASRPARDQPRTHKRATGLTDLLVRDVEPQLKHRIAQSARKSGNSLSAEAKKLIERGLARSEQSEGIGTLLFSLVRDEDRGDDLVFEVPDVPSPPPDFE